MVALPLVALDLLHLVDGIDGDRADGAELAHDCLGQTGGLICGGRLSLHGTEVTVLQTFAADRVGEVVGATELDAGRGRRFAQVDVDIGCFLSRRFALAAALGSGGLVADLEAQIVRSVFGGDRSGRDIARRSQCCQTAVSLCQFTNDGQLFLSDACDVFGDESLVDRIGRFVDLVASGTNKYQGTHANCGSNLANHSFAPDYTRVECRETPDTLLLTILVLIYFSSVCR